MSRFRRLFPDAEEHPQNPTQQTGRLPNHDLHSSYLLSFKQTIPQAISRKATRNIRQPTGNTAAMKMPNPSASAQIPRQCSPFPLMWFPPPCQASVLSYVAAVEAVTEKRKAFPGGKTSSFPVKASQNSPLRRRTFCIVFRRDMSPEGLPLGVRGEKHFARRECSPAHIVCGRTRVGVN